MDANNFPAQGMAEKKIKQILAILLQEMPERAIFFLINLAAGRRIPLPGEIWLFMNFCSDANETCRRKDKISRAAVSFWAKNLVMNL